MSFCVCGGYLGNGGPSMFAGRHCQCLSPRLSESQLATTTLIAGLMTISTQTPEVGQMDGEGNVWTGTQWVKYVQDQTLLSAASLEQLIEAIENKGFKITLERK
jgi:hypothetical protein